MNVLRVHKDRFCSKLEFGCYHCYCVSICLLFDFVVHNTIIPVIRPRHRHNSIDSIIFVHAQNKGRRAEERKTPNLVWKNRNYSIFPIELKWAWKIIKPYGANLVLRRTIQRNCYWSRWMHRHWLPWMVEQRQSVQQMVIILHLMILVLMQFVHRNRHRHRHRRHSVLVALQLLLPPQRQPLLLHVNRLLCHWHSKFVYKISGIRHSGSLWRDPKIRHGIRGPWRLLF